MNILITTGDGASENFFKGQLKKHTEATFDDVMGQTSFYFVYRTNQVKQSYVTAVLTGLRSVISALSLTVNRIPNTTHFVSNGPGTCVPFFFILRILKLLRLSRAKLIFV